jgi:hypothetical protein
MESTLTWNITCSLINTTTLIEIANIVEESVYNTMDSTLPNDLLLEYVYVDKLCNTTVGGHPGFPTARRLEVGTSDIKLFEVVSKNCVGCQEDIFNTTNAALVEVVNDGSLSSSIQNKSGDVITADFSGNVTSNFTVTTSRPTSAPTATPVTSAPVAPVTNAPVSTSPVTASPVNKAPPVTVQPVSVPTTASPVNQVPPASAQPTKCPTKVMLHDSFSSFMTLSVTVFLSQLIENEKE